MQMLYYKSWLDTRWRFLIGLALMTCSAVAIVAMYPRAMQLASLVPAVDTGGELGRRIREAVALAREFRGFIWSQWYRQTPRELGTLFAILLGSGSLLSHGAASGALFTLSLPVSRNRLLGARAATGLGELLVLAVVPSLFIPFLSPAVGESYRVIDALAHGLCLFAGFTVFFSLALLLSTMFEDVWRPFLIALTVAIVIGLVEGLLREPLPFGLFSMMSGESYFRSGQLPWVGFVTSLALSTALLYGAATNIGHRDY